MSMSIILLALVLLVIVGVAVVGIAALVYFVWYRTDDDTPPDRYKE